MSRLKIALAQINTTVGDVYGNSRKIIDYIKRARSQCADIVAFPELALSGYPPEDLLLKKAFIRENRDSLKDIVRASKDIFSIVGFPYYDKKGIYNSAALIYDKRLIDVYHKMVLPNYGVFDEKRYFSAGNEIQVAPFGRIARIGISICEDIWHKFGPDRIAVLDGKADIIINISASPYHTGKIRERQRLIRKKALKNRAFICYCNAVGGQDELVFDGGSLVYGPNGKLFARGGQFKEELIFATLDLKSPKRTVGNITKPLSSIEEIYHGLYTGLKDYVHKNGFQKVVLGLSGGIDSALTASICCDALGSENVIAFSMPSRFSSKATINDAKILADGLGIKLIRIPIDKLYKTYIAYLRNLFKGKARDITEENLQARIRGNLLMAASNKFGWLVVTTGNKSEISVGYCTLYGDTAGGFAVLKDVPKTTVYDLARLINKKAGREVIPGSVIKRAPSAELKFGQKDQDTLPSYSILDKILDLYIEKDMSSEDISRAGFSKRLVNKVLSMVDKSEYKRRQSPPGVKITPKALGRDRRMPIVNRWKS